MSKNEVAPVQPARINVPGIVKVEDAELLKELEGVAGAGLSDSIEDQGTPLLYIAQKGSPQVDERDAKFIKDLKQGMAFNNLTGQMYDAEHVGLPFLPCFMRVTWDEWTPRNQGGGFHGSHPRNTDMAALKAVPFKRDEKSKARRDIYVLPDGHELKLTAKYYGVLPETWSPIVIPMASTSLGCSSRLQAMIKEQKLQVGNSIIVKPAYFTNFRLKTVYDTNDDGTWFRWEVAGIDGPNENKELRNFCKAFALACQNNEVKEAAPQPDSVPVGGAPNDDDIPV